MIEADGSGEYILIAEDNPADVYLVREALEERLLTYGLTVVSDGERVVEFIQGLDRTPSEVPPALLLLDLHLPKRDGQEILRCWRASARCGGIPVIVFSASADPLEIEAATRHPGTHYFRKPTTLDQFLELGDLIGAIIDSNAHRLDRSSQH